MGDRSGARSPEFEGVSSEHTQALLGWVPEHATLLEDLETGDYFTPQASIRAEEIWLPHHDRHEHSQS